MTAGLILLRGWSTKSKENASAETPASTVSEKPKPRLEISEEGILLFNSMSVEQRDWCLSWAFWLHSILRMYAVAGSEVQKLRELALDPQTKDKWRKLVENANLARRWEGEYRTLFSDLVNGLALPHVFKDAQSFVDIAALALADRNEEWPEPEPPDTTRLEDLVELLLALIPSIGASVVFEKSINALLLEAKTSREQALFEAIRIDRGVLATPTANELVRKAALEGDDGFFTRLATALSTPVPNVKQFEIDLEIGLMLIRASGGLSRLNSKAAQLIFLEVQPPIYGDSGEDPLGSLLRRVQRFKSKARTIARQGMS